MSELNIEKIASDAFQLQRTQIADYLESPKTWSRDHGAEYCFEKGYVAAYDSLELELARTKKMLDEAKDAFLEIAKIRRKDGNDNEYEGAEVYISNRFLAKHEKKEGV